MVKREKQIKLENILVIIGWSLLIVLAILMILNVLGWI